MEKDCLNASHNKKAAILDHCIKSGNQIDTANSAFELTEAFVSTTAIEACQMIGIVAK